MMDEVSKTSNSEFWLLLWFVRHGFEAPLGLEMRAVISSLFLLFGLKKEKLRFGRLTIRDDSEIWANLIQCDKNPQGKERTREDSVTTIINAFTTEVQL
jgi:hypothetical protein